jgi:hypothetical protein
MVCLEPAKSPYRGLKDQRTIGVVIGPKWVHFVMFYCLSVLTAGSQIFEDTDSTSLNALPAESPHSHDSPSVKVCVFMSFAHAC